MMLRWRADDYIPPVGPPEFLLICVGWLDGVDLSDRTDRLVDSNDGFREEPD